MKNSGFTLLELLVVLVIISLISGLIAPRFVNSLTNMNLKTSAKSIAASLKYARSQATSERSTYISVFDFDKKMLILDKYQKEESGIQNSEFRNEDNKISKPKIYTLPDGIKFEKAKSINAEVNSGQFEILFYPVGNSSGGEIIIADERERHYKISVDFITGIVEIN